jgi:hypothetical protein
MSRRVAWSFWVGSIVATLLLSTFGRPMQHWVYANLGVGFAAWVIGGLLVLSVVLVLRWMLASAVRQQGMGSEKHGENFRDSHTKYSAAQSTRRQSITQVILIGLLLFVAVAVIVLVLDRPEERLHFVTFGFYGFFTAALFAARSLLLALVLVALFSGLDELYQWWLPDRVGDWRDVAMNMLAGSIGLVLQRMGARGNS